MDPLAHPIGRVAIQVKADHIEGVVRVKAHRVRELDSLLAHAVAHNKVLPFGVRQRQQSRAKTTWDTSLWSGVG